MIQCSPSLWSAKGSAWHVDMLLCLASSDRLVHVVGTACAHSILGTVVKTRDVAPTLPKPSPPTMLAYQAKSENRSMSKWTNKVNFWQWRCYAKEMRRLKWQWGRSQHSDQEELLPGCGIWAEPWMTGLGSRSWGQRGLGLNTSSATC